MNQVASQAAKALWYQVTPDLHQIIFTCFNGTKLISCGGRAWGQKKQSNDSMEWNQQSMTETIPH